MSIGVAPHLVQLKVASAKTFLHPELAYCQVADTPDATAAANADRGPRMCVHPDCHLKAEVFAPRLNAEGFGRTFNEAIEFRFG